MGAIPSHWWATTTPLKCAPKSSTTAGWPWARRPPSSLCLSSPGSPPFSSSESIRTQPQSPQLLLQRRRLHHDVELGSAAPVRSLILVTPPCVHELPLAGLD